MAAYELEHAGFLVTVVEARDGVGGRNWTIRGGDTVEPLGRPTQTAGAARRTVGLIAERVRADRLVQAH